MAVDIGEVEKLALCSGERWFLARTLPHREATAESHLKRQGFRSFLPQSMKTVRHARKLRNVNAPIFPRYLFVALKSRTRSLAQRQ